MFFEEVQIHVLFFFPFDFTVLLFADDPLKNHLFVENGKKSRGCCSPQKKKNFVLRQRVFTKKKIIIKKNS